MDSNKEEVPTDHPLNTDELNKAALSFQTNIKIIKQQTRTIPKKSLERVFDAVVEFPLSDKQPQFKNQREKDLFFLTISALSAKNVMVDAVLKHQKETLALLEDANENKGEDNNG